MAEESSNIFNKVFVGENLSCTSEMELTYYSAAIFPDTCIHCASKQNLIKSIEHYPQKVRNVTKKVDVLRRKRKNSHCDRLKKQEGKVKEDSHSTSIKL